MFLRYFQRGEQLTAEKLNSLVDAIRQSALQSGPGYNVQQTPSGTTLSITQQGGGGGSVGGTSGAACVWSVSDISETGENGRLNLKLRVGCSDIENTGRYPIGASIQQPYYDIDLGLNQGPGWLGVYVEVRVDQQNHISSDINAVRIGWSDKWRGSNSIIQRTYLAGVTISLDTESHPYISFIDQYCPLVTITERPACPFLIEDWSMGEIPGDPQISIRSAQIQRTWPTGMDALNTYRLTLSGDNPWYAVYAYIATDQLGNILTAENSVTLGTETEYKTSTPSLTYFLLGEVNVGYDEDSNKVIDFIYNSCTYPLITGAVTVEGTVIPRGIAASCPFRAIGEIHGGFQFVRLEQNTVATPNARWPAGMGPGYSPYYIPITQTTYIYVKIVYLDDDVIVHPEPYGVTIDVSPELKENTVNEEYVLVSVVAFADGAITTITNTCANVTANPCNLKWN